MRVLVSRSLEHPTLPDAEFGAVMDAEGLKWSPGDTMGRLRIGDVEGDLVAFRRAIERLAMTHEVTELWIHTDAGPSHLSAAARAHPLPDAQPFVVRAERVSPDSPRGPMTRGDVERTLGAAWEGQAPVSLDAPERVVRVWLDDEDALIGERLWACDRAGFDARASKNRPFFSPVSGHPRWMRAIVNLARVSRGATVYDPLCGTGGIVLEAALSGMRAIGSDIDPEMVEGTNQNLKHYEAAPEALFQSDVREAPDRLADVLRLPAVDAVVTDLPYGQSASTTGAEPADVAEWTLETAARVVAPGGHVVIGAADEAWLRRPPSVLERLESFDLRVHKSLTRTYVVYRRQ